MLIGGVASSGQTALHKGLNRIDQAADQIAKASMGRDAEARPTDLTKPVVELKQADLETQAAVKLLDVENKTVGRFLDEMA